jgi:hypothetical protein
MYGYGMAKRDERDRAEDLEPAGLAAKVAGAPVVEGLGRGQERIEETKGISMVVLTGAEDNGAGRKTKVNAAAAR